MKNFFFLILSSIIGLVGQCQVITTIAGDGAADNSGDGGPATAAHVYIPGSGAFDTAGSFYFSVPIAYRVRKVSRSGIISTCIGNGSVGYLGDGGAATDAKISRPQGLTGDKKGNVYFCDYDNNVVRKVNVSTGEISAFAGNGMAGFSGDGGLATDAMLNHPINVFCDRLGNVYVAEVFNNRVRRIDSTGVITTFAGDGTYGLSGFGGAATAAELTPIGLCDDSKGNIYISDNSLGTTCILKVDLSGTISLFAGTPANDTFNGDGIPATDAGIGPFAIMSDKYDDILICDDRNNMIRIVDSTGRIFTICGTGPAGYNGDDIAATEAELNEPEGFAMDANGDIYLCDSYNFRIRKISSGRAAVFTPFVENSITLAPNPATTHLTITTPTPIQTLTLSNYLGQAVLRREGRGGDVDVSGLLAGVYLVQVVMEDGHREFGKFVKE